MLGDTATRRRDDALHRRARHEGFSATTSATRSSSARRARLKGARWQRSARELWLSPNTVKTHRRSIYRKLGATTREEMIVRAQRGWDRLAGSELMFTRVNDAGGDRRREPPI